MSRVYLTYLAIMLIFNALIWATPFIAKSQDASLLYSGFSYTCHQLTARSICLYESEIGDCVKQEGIFYNSRANTVSNELGTGYKFPVDVRDMAIYGAMLVAGLALPLFYDPKSKVVPNLMILIVAALPVGIDGFTQLLGWRESVNLIRIITGLILGAAIPFFLIPVVNFFVNKFKRSDSNAN